MAMAAMRRLVAIGRRMNPSEMFTSLESFASSRHLVIWYLVFVDRLLNFSIEQR
jgi:hypothetical protein